MFRSFTAQLFKSRRVTLDNFVFRLHYRVTVGLLLTCAVALLWKINYLSPIQCVDRDGTPQTFMNDLCWYQGVHTNRNTTNQRVGIDVVAPGMGYSRDPNDRLYHGVHRWIVIAVLVQAAFFFIPRIIWRTIEGDQVRKWMWNMNNVRNMDSLNLIRKQQIATQLKFNSFVRLRYVAGCVLSEVLNLINVVVQLGLVYRMLQTSGSLDFMVRSRDERRDVSAQTSFPLRTKCLYYRYGPSGDVQRHDAQCIMSINGFMETMFVCQYIWFSFLTVWSVLALLYRLGTLAIPQIRALRLQAKVKLAGHDIVTMVTRKLGIGEWFMLYMLSKNLDPIHMKDIMEYINEGSSNGKSQPMSEFSNPMQP